MQALKIIIVTALFSCESPPRLECAEEDEVFVFVDADEDGFGTDPLGYYCSVGPGQALNSLDCDDTRADVNPAAEDACDEIDNNCDGRIDEGVQNIAYFPDADEDGFGDPAGEFITCLGQPEGYVRDSNDCDDERKDVFPGNPEICANGIDEDCSGVADDIPEICNDGLDNDCDGFADCSDDECADALLCCADIDLGAVAEVSFDGATGGQGNDFDSGCAPDYAPDVAHAFTAPDRGNYRIDTFGSRYDTVLAIYDACDQPSIACNDDAGFGLQSEVVISLDAGETVLVSVDGYSNSRGQYSLNIRRE